jgi:hypothetical protein
MVSKHSHPPRPRWNDRKVKETAVDVVFDAVLEWALSSGALDEDADHRHLRALVALSLSESADAYGAGRYLETFADMPTDGSLIRILDRAYTRMPQIAESATMDWVMKHGVRFGAKKGDVLRFRVGDLELTGTVAAIVARTATGYVEVKGTGKVLPLTAEDIIENLGPPPVAKKTPPKRRT